MNRFFESVAGVLEVDEVGLETDFRSAPGWCSLHGFGLLVMMENDFAAPLTIDEFLKLKTVGDLYERAFAALIAGIVGSKASEIRADSKLGDFAGWDSVNHLRIFMEAEKRFGIRYELSEMPGVKTLSDFIRTGKSE